MAIVRNKNKNFKSRNNSNRENNEKQMSNSKLKKDKKNVERGPTKKELREELMNKKKGKKASGSSLDKKSLPNKDKKEQPEATEKSFDKKNKLSKDDKDKKIKPAAENKNKKSEKRSKTVDSKSNDNTVTESEKKSIKKSNKLARKLNTNKKLKANKKLKNKKDAKNQNKVVYTPENVNSYLLELKNAESKDKATTLLLYLFKTLKKSPSELLAKIKILTSDKKIKTENDSVQTAVLKHLFSYYSMKGSFLENLSSFIKADTLLSKYVSEFYFKSAFESEEFALLYNEILSLLSKTLSKTAVLSFEDYQSYVSQINTYADIEDFNIDDQNEEEVESKEVKSDNIVNIKPEEQNNLPDEEESSSASAVSLVSLDDTEEINRLDENLGKLFSKGMLSIEDENFGSNLIKCLELLVNNNDYVNIEMLTQILYFYQFNYIATQVKFVTKDILKKLNDQQAIFKAFRMAAMVVPAVYSLFSTFTATCGDAFNLVKFLDSVVKFGHEEYIINKINRDQFYSIYESTLGENIDLIMIELIKTETNKDKLKLIDSQYLKEDIRSVVQERLSSLESKKQKSIKKEVKPVDE